MRLTTNGALTIDFEGREVLGALRRRLVVERSTITHLRFHASYEVSSTVWRLFGTSLPRKLFAGWFRREGCSEFWYIRNPRGIVRVSAEDVLEIETTGRFGRVLLTVSQPDAERVIAWAGF